MRLELGLYDPGRMVAILDSQRYRGFIDRLARQGAFTKHGRRGSSNCSAHPHFGLAIHEIMIKD